MPYEGLLDHTAVRASEVMVGVRGTRKKEPEIALSTLEALLAHGEDKLLDNLAEETDRSVSALRRELQNGGLLDEHKLLRACNHDHTLVARLRSVGDLIREDSFERPWIVLPGSVFVTAGTTRRSTGTHYTPPSLTEPIVHQTLEPLVYVGPAEGLPKENWKLKSPKEILELKVCDMAMGSGAFLVQACRYLAERLVEAWESEEKAHPGQLLITPDGQFSEGLPTERLVPAEVAERIATARRVVADRCLYGVDINPMAVEMAKLSMWLITVDSSRPFTFLDHSFKCGDSLVGIGSFKQLELFSLRPEEVKQVAFSTLNLWRHVEEARGKRELLEAMPSDTPEQVAAKAALYLQAQEAVAKLTAAADVLLATELKGLKGKKYEEALERAADQMMLYWTRGTGQLRQYADDLLNTFKTFHWPLAFPEIEVRGGFDAFVGNPPYLGGRKIRGALGGSYLDFITTSLFPKASANADLCAFFVRRAYALLRKLRTGGFITTSSISEGDTRQVCLQHVLESGGSIIFAASKEPWPGAAGVTYTPIVLLNGEWRGEFLLDGKRVSSINSYLAEPSGIAVPPFRLGWNYLLSFQGSIPLGKGFVLTDAEAQALFSSDPRNRDIIQPYLVGQELNIDPDHRPSQWIINFFDWPLDRESAPSHHAGPVASDYPDCLQIIRAKVYPERTRRKDNGDYVLRRPLPQKWWIYGDKRPELYARLKALKWALAIATQATKYVAFGKVFGTQVYSNAIAIIATDDDAIAGVLASSIHESWARQYGGYNLLLLRYSPSDLFDTFPLPCTTLELSKLGAEYYSLRDQIMRSKDEGLTKTYNRFHDPTTFDADIQELRKFHVQLDRAIVDSYGWSDVNLGHGFHETKQGLRFTIGDASRRELLDRLLALNHQRHAEEVAAAAAQAAIKPDKGGRKKKEIGSQAAIAF